MSRSGASYASPADVAAEAAARAAADASLATLDSPTFTGSPSLPAGTTVVTAAPGDSDTSPASTAYVQTELAALVSLSPATAARNTIQPTADVVPLTLKGKASQTADLLNLRDSSANLLASIGKDGNLTIKGTQVLYQAVFADVIQDSTGTSNTIRHFYRSNGADQLSLIVNGSAATNPGRANYTTKGGVRFACPGGTTTVVTYIVEGAASQTANLAEFRDSTPNALLAVTAAGLLQWVASGNQQTTVGAAGGASALPATPTKYLKVVDSAGTTLVIPAYAAA